ncbi:MAG: LEA type 2 family protein [Halobellus sp.]|uniref:LEA type 2 family protein n=1 Tax=Halobellus sp. TaxID=1979212 RepID=UPI0035D40F26
MPTLSLFGRIRSLVVVLLLGGLIVGGAFAVGVIGAPSVAGVENRFGPVNETTTVVETNLTVSNPNPIGVSLGGVTVGYDVSFNEVTLASGVEDGVSVGTGNSTLTFRTTARNERIPPWWVSHVRNDERTTVTVDASVRSSTLGRTADPPNVTREIETDLLSQFNSTETRSIDANQPLVSDPVLYVNETTAQWGTVSTQRTPMNLTFVVYNPKPYPIAISQLEYDVTMNEIEVGNGTTESEYVIPPKSTETVEATVTIRNDRIDEWWVTHLERNQVTDLRIAFAARLELSDRSVRVPLDSLTYTRRIETDIFGTKPSDGNATGSSGTSTPTAEPETEQQTDEETTETDASTTAPTPTATPGSTATDTSGADGTATTDGGTATDSGTGTTTDGGLIEL